MDGCVAGQHSNRQSINHFSGKIPKHSQVLQLEYLLIFLFYIIVNWWTSHVKISISKVWSPCVIKLIDFFFCSSHILYCCWGLFLVIHAGNSHENISLWYDKTHHLLLISVLLWPGSVTPAQERFSIEVNKCAQGGVTTAAVKPLKTASHPVTFLLYQRLSSSPAATVSFTLNFWYYHPLCFTLPAPLNKSCAIISSNSAFDIDKQFK